jgi:hypothetical protein
MRNPKTFIKLTAAVMLGMTWLNPAWAAETTPVNKVEPAQVGEAKDTGNSCETVPGSDAAKQDTVESSSKTDAAAAGEGPDRRDGTAQPTDARFGISPPDPGAAQKSAEPAQSNSTQTSNEDAHHYWKSNLDSSNDTFSVALRAVTGKPNPDWLNELLHGVVQINRKKDVIEFVREDNEILQFDHGTNLGDKMLDALSSVRRKAEKKFGSEAADIVGQEFSMKLSGNHVDVAHDGPAKVLLDLRKQKKKLKYKVKEVKLEKVSFEVDTKLSEHPRIVNITGVHGVVSSGLELPVELRDFSRATKGDMSVYTLGIKNPVPIPFHNLFGFGDVMHVKIKTSTSKKKKRSFEVAQEKEGHGDGEAAISP